MELQIQDLVSSIKKDGIDSANKEAAVILTDAKKQADALLAEARKEADKLRQDARDDAEVFKSSALLSAQQAKRDAVLAFSQAVQKEFEKLLASDISKALDEKALADLIRAGGRTPPPMPPRSPRSPTASVPSLPGSWRRDWKFARLRRWGPGSAWPPRTAPAISTALRRRSPGCSTPSSGTHACKGVPAWLPITISSPASPCCAPEASRPWTTPSFCASAAQR